MKHTVPERSNGETHWVGLDVSKKTFDAALAQSNQRFPSTPVRELPWKAFPRTRSGVAGFLVTFINASATEWLLYGRKLS